MKAYSVMSQQNPGLAAAASQNNLEEPLSMIEKTAKRILPVIAKVQKCLIKESGQ